MKREKLHKNFQLNGKSFSSEEDLLTFSSGFSDEIHQFLTVWFSKEDFILVYTSGSTGVPKEIKLLKSKMVNSALATAAYFRLKESTTALLCLPIAYIAGKMMLVRALTLGWHLDVVSPNSFPLRGIQKQYNFSAMVPLQLQNSLEQLHLIKMLIVGGGVVSSQLLKKLQDSATNVFATFGMTETITHIAIKKLNNFSSLTADLIKQPLNHQFYEVLPNVEIYKDTRNCLVINAPKVADTLIFTNDIVRLISDTQFEWVGRFDTIINSGGVKLHPEKIEKALSTEINARFFVAGMPDNRLGQKLILIVEGNHQTIAMNNTGLSKFEIPKQIYFVEKFVETATKKIQRKKTLDLIG